MTGSAGRATRSGEPAQHASSARRHPCDGGWFVIGDLVVDEPRFGLAGVIGGGLWR